MMKNKYRFKHRRFYYKHCKIDKLLRKLIKDDFTICFCGIGLEECRPVKTEVSEEEIHRVEECIRRASVTAFNIEYSKEALEKIYGIKTR